MSIYHKRYNIFLLEISKLDSVAVSVIFCYNIYVYVYIMNQGNQCMYVGDSYHSVSHLLHELRSVSGSFEKIKYFKCIII